MKDEFLTNDTEKGYTLGQVAECTGLSDRTLRNYLAMGLLEGEKINGVWRFTPKQVGDFIANATVYPSILAKNNAVVYDFLSERDKTADESCIILDLPTQKWKSVSSFFCEKINSGKLHNVRFHMDAPKKKTLRVILKGYTKDVLRLVNEYYAQIEKE